MHKATYEKFGYPETLIKSYEYWDILLRPAQVTLGSLILICKSPITQYGDLSRSAALEQSQIVSEIEQTLKSRFHFSKINYLMLMMVDPAVHFHVIPRYDHSITFGGEIFKDAHWPGPPNLGRALEVHDSMFKSLIQILREDFSGPDNNLDGLAQQKQEKKYKRMYTSGCFDIFHHGHLNILKKSKELCDYLVVGVSTDELILQAKGKLPAIPFEQRAEIVASNTYVDEVIPQKNKNKNEVVEKHHIDAISVGSDWRGKYPEVSCDLVYFDYTDSVSSTFLKKNLNDEQASNLKRMREASISNTPKP